MSRPISVPIASIAAEAVKELRLKLGLTQEQLAKKIGVRRNIVLLWEKGPAEPKAENSIALAKLALESGHRSLALSFLTGAGIDERVFRALLPEVEEFNRRFGERIKHLLDSQEGRDALNLPFIENFAHGQPRTVTGRLLVSLAQKSDRSVSFPKFAILRPAQTVCVAAPDAYMLPIFGPGDVVAIDLGDEPFDPTDDGALVASYKKPAPGDAADKGRFQIRRLRFSEAGEIRLSTEIGEIVGHTFDRGYAKLAAELGMSGEAIKEGWATVDVTERGDWSIVGRVVAWIGSDAATRTEQESRTPERAKVKPRKRRKK